MMTDKAMSSGGPSGATVTIPGMRVAVVDVGSNTARVLVADVSPDGRVVSVGEERERLGLGAEIARTGALSRETVRTVARACRRYAKLACSLDAERATTIVTAPGRQGRGTGLLVDALAEATGLDVRVLTAEEEGCLAYDGALARLGRPIYGPVAVVDVGGGSTEIVVGAPGHRARWVHSIDLGSIRLTRQHLRRDPPRRAELQAARQVVRAALDGVAPPAAGLALATGGSARAVAKLVGGRTFGSAEIEGAIATLSSRRSAKVARSVGIHPVRAASVIGGALVLAETARMLERPLELSRSGLREGAALALAGRSLSVAA